MMRLKRAVGWIVGGLSWWRGGVWRRDDAEAQPAATATPTAGQERSSAKVSANDASEVEIART